MIPLTPASALPNPPRPSEVAAQGVTTPRTVADTRVWRADRARQDALNDIIGNCSNCGVTDTWVLTLFATDPVVICGSCMMGFRLAYLKRVDHAKLIRIIALIGISEGWFSVAVPGL